MTMLSGIAASNPQTQAVPLTPAGASASGTMSFQDFLDTVNPLQHIPVVSSLYNSATGATPMSTGAKLAGDTLYGILMGGGALGIAASVGSAVADAAVTQSTGSDITTHVLNTVSSVTSSPAVTGPAATPLVADAGQPAVINAQAPAANTTPQFFPVDPHPAATAGQYRHAQIQDVFDKKLEKMI